MTQQLAASRGKERAVRCRFARRARGLIRLALPFLLLSSASTTVSAQQLRPERCAECHSKLSDDRLSKPARLFPTDIHAQKGFGCLACHGGAAGHDAAAGFLSKPERRDIPRLCGQCHSDAQYMKQFNPALRTDQVSEYWTSVHGHRLAEANDPNVATCVDCHRVHEIRPPNDPKSSVFPLNVAETCGHCHADDKRMAQYRIPTDQLSKWRQSVHGRLMSEKEDLSAPTCNDCHGNHGATPPGIGSIRNVCGQCHATNADFFSASGHVEIFEKAGLPGCETCHSNHAIMPVSDDILVRRNDEVCRRCHAQNDTLGGEFRAMALLLDSLKTSFDESQQILRDAANGGMEVSQAQFELEDVNNALTKARSSIHTFHVEPVRTNVEAGLKLTAAGIARGRDALGEHTFRRQGLALSGLVILLLITGLLLKIRQLEARSAHANGAAGSLEEDTHG